MLFWRNGGCGLRAAFCTVLLIAFSGASGGRARAQGRDAVPALCEPESCAPASEGCPWDPVICACACSVVLMDLEQADFQAQLVGLTNLHQGVDFDLNGDGLKERAAWTAGESGLEFLVLDRNANGVVDDGSEMLGSAWPQADARPALLLPDGSSVPKGGLLDRPNGFLALAGFDRPENGGDDNGLIDARDSVFSRLRLWRDANHNGKSEPEELRTLADRRVTALEVAYEMSSGKDLKGNWLRFLARVRVRTENGVVERLARDCLLVTSLPGKNDAVLR